MWKVNWRLSVAGAHNTRSAGPFLSVSTNSEKVGKIVVPDSVEPMGQHRRMPNSGTQSSWFKRFEVHSVGERFRPHDLITGVFDALHTAQASLRLQRT